jgi:predicted enzyme related to lactoylglutathione lyase
MECAQVRLAVDDFVAMFRFYRDVIGLAPKVDDERGPYAKFSWPGGGSALALQLRSHVAATVGEEHASGHGGVLLAVRVADVDAVAQELCTRGATLLGATKDVWGMRVAHVIDPEGHVLELQAWPSTTSSAGGSSR